jgi:hypothetical protein
MSPRTDFESTIHDVIDAHVRSTPAREPDLAAIVQRGRHRRALHSGAAAVAVAGVVAVILNLAGLGFRGDQNRGPVSPIAAGDTAVAKGGARGPVAVNAPSRVFLTKDRIYLDGRSTAVRTPWDGAESGDPPPESAPARDKVQVASTSSIHVARDGIVYPGADNRPMLLNRQGVLLPLAPVSPAFAGARYADWVVADPGSGLVVWSEVGATEVRIVAYDTGRRAVIGSRTLTCDDTSFAIGCPVPYVASDGLVFLEGDDNQTWNPRTGEVVTLRSGAMQVRNRVADGPDQIGVERLGPEWAQVKAPDKSEQLLSFDGGWLLEGSARPEVINWRAPAQRIRYRVPGTMTMAVFDTDGSVLVVTHDRGTYTGWDCAATSKCQAVVPAGKGEIRLVGWDT